MKLKERLQWADLAKGFGILLVKIGHHETFLTKAIVCWIYSFHMPLFFFVSGFFISPNLYIEKSMKDIVRYKIRRILFPYFIYSIIYWGVMQCQLVLQYNSVVLSNIDWKGLIGIFVRIPDTAYISDHWFFWTLFWSEVVFIFLLKIVGNRIKCLMFGCTFLSFIAFIFVRKLGIKLVWNFDVACMVLPFVFSGYWFKIHYEDVKKIIIKNTNIIAFLLVSSLFCYINYKIGMDHIDYNRREMWEFVSCILAGLAGIAFVLSICLKSRPIPFIQYIGRNSAIYYLTSWIGEWIFPRMLVLCGFDLSGGVLFACQIVGACLFPIPIIWFVKQALPRITSVYQRK